MRRHPAGGQEFPVEDGELVMHEALVGDSQRAGGDPVLLQDAVGPAAGPPGRLEHDNLPARGAQGLCGGEASRARSRPEDAGRAEHQP